MLSNTLTPGLRHLPRYRHFIHPAHPRTACSVGSPQVMVIQTPSMAAAGAGSGEGMQSADARRRELQQDVLLPSGQELQVEGAGVPPGAISVPPEASHTLFPWRRCTGCNTGSGMHSMAASMHAVVGISSKSAPHLHESTCAGCACPEVARCRASTELSSFSHLGRLYAVQQHSNGRETKCLAMQAPS